MKFQHPCFGFFPALPLQKNLELGDWVVGVPAEDTPWRSARFKELVSKLLDSFASDKFGDKFSGGALVWRKAAGFDGTPPSPDEFVAIQAAVRFAALDSNDRVDKEDQNGGHYLVTSENAALHVQPIDEGTGHITLVRQGLLKRILTGGWTIGQRPPPLADATMPMLGQVLASNKLSAAIFQAHVAPNTELLRRLRIAIEWHTVALSNPVAVTIQQRLIALKTGFEALTGTSASRECARKLRHLFETTTESHRNLLPWAGILWSPTERTDLLRYTQKGCRFTIMDLPWSDRSRATPASFSGLGSGFCAKQSRPASARRSFSVAASKNGLYLSACFLRYRQLRNLQSCQALRFTPIMLRLHLRVVLPCSFRN